MTHRENETRVAAEPTFAPERGTTVLIVLNAHDVWFQSLRDELSLRYEYKSSVQCGNEKYRRIFDTNPEVEVRTSSDLPLKSLRA